MNLYDNVKKIAKKRGMSLQEVAKESHLGANTIYKWRIQTPRADTLAKVASTLGVTINELTGEREPSAARNTGENIQNLGLFRKTVNENNLSDKEQKELADDISSYLKFRAKRLREKRGN